MAKGLMAWIDARFPLMTTWKAHVSEYYVPKNLNFWYFFGSLAGLVFVNQIITGLWLTMFYTPSAKSAFSSVEYIMRDVNYGWLLRYMHSTGASAFFVVIYLHMFRGLLYGSYKKPRELIWLIGCALFLLLLAEAFFGYLLPWGQMSFWGAQVITSLFGAIPYVGDTLVTWLRGDYNVADATLHRFFALHVVGIPLVMLFLVFIHMVALHQVGSNNPEGIEIKKHVDKNNKPLDGIPFHPYFTVKDFVGVVVFFIVFFAIVFFFPEMGGYFLEHANFIPADPMVTPDHIAPVWYMTPFYAILRAIPHKFFGVVAMGASVSIFFLLPWIDRSNVKSIRYRGTFTKIALTLFAVAFIALGYLGTVTVTPVRQVLAQVFSVIYFAFFIFMPFYTRYEKTKPVPERIGEQS
jgi:ubiquinol-cytochrome c reductase cytochrome b subunit